MIFEMIKTAKQLLFNNSGTGLEANNTEDAIKELNQTLSELTTRLGTPTVLAISKGHSYTMPTNGYIQLDLVTSGDNGFALVLINGVAFSMYSYNGHRHSNRFYLGKGQTFELYNFDHLSELKVTYIPLVSV